MSASRTPEAEPVSAPRTPEAEPVSAPRTPEAEPEPTSTPLFDSSVVEECLKAEVVAPR